MDRISRHLLIFLALVISSIAFVSCATKSDLKRRTYAGATPLQWSKRMANSEIARLDDSRAWKPGGRAKWDYAVGLFSWSLLKLNAVAPKPRYVSFVKTTIGSFITPSGKIHTYHPKEYQLDALNSGRPVLALWEMTHNDRYKKAAARLIKQLATQPRTPQGGFWHKLIYTNQMWLDGLYMAEPFYAEYTKIFHGPASAFNDVVTQFCLIDQHSYDPRTGLFFHGWDAAKIQSWANPITGCSSNIWGRGVGWYAMALVDTLDYLPANHPDRSKIVSIFQKLAAAVVRYQDPKTGLWWQVMNLGGRPGNYREATASAMFVYALAKGVNRGYLSRDYIPAIKKGYAGIVNHLIVPDGHHRWSITHCCAVAGLGFKDSAGRPRDGSFSYYISEPVVTNDLKGIGPFILAGVQLHELSQTQ